MQSSLPVELRLVIGISIFQRLKFAEIEIILIPIRARKYTLISHLA